MEGYLSRVPGGRRLLISESERTLIAKYFQARESLAVRMQSWTAAFGGRTESSRVL